jgi:hypothetical protein
MPWVAFRHMSDVSLDAIFAALQTVLPVDHNVANSEPPTPCAACGGEHGGGEWNRPMELAGIALDEELLAELAGVYRFPDGAELVLTITDGQLTSDDSGPLFAQEDGAFLSGLWGAPLRFERDADGRVVRLHSIELTPWVGERVE